MENLNAEKHNVKSDVRAEVLASSLLDSGTRDFENIVINPTGSSYRAVRNDIVRIHDGLDLFDALQRKSPPNDLLFIDVSRPGLYDYLPEGFFHSSEAKTKSKTVEDTVKEIEENRKQESSARMFFLALEKEVNRSRITLEMEERKSILGFSEHYKADLFLRIWPDLKNLDQKMLVTIFQLLPVSHVVSNNPNMLSIVLRAVFGKKFSVTIDSSPRIVEHGLNFNKLGENWLGINTVLGEKFADYDPIVTLEVADLRRTELSKYLIGGEYNKVISLLIDFFMPSFYDHIIMYQLVDFEEDLVLSDHESESYLNHNSRL